MASLVARSRPHQFTLAAAYLATCALSAVGCSSSSATPPPPAPPAWDAAPATLDVYDGRIASVPIAIKASDLTKLTVTAASDAVAAELVPAEAPSTDGLWHGTLKIRPGYALAAGDAGTVTVDIKDTVGSLHKTIALQAHKLSWKKRVVWTPASGPQTREHGVFFLDPEAKAAYLLQGSGYSPQLKPLADSWRLDVASGAWAAWTPTGDVPPPGGSRRVAAIPGGKKFYAYGGYVGFETTADDEADIYRVDLADAARTFTKLTNVTPGPARELHAVAYDAKSDTFVVFGGVTTKPTQDVLDDTWTIKIVGDTATWTTLAAKKSPTPRYGSFSAFDADSRRFIVWSGAQVAESATDPINAAQDAWALDLSASPPTWSKLEPTGTAPKGRRNGCSMPDPAGRRLFVYGGTSDGKTTEKGLFVLDLEPGHETWTRLDLANAPPLRSSGFGFATPDGDVTCAFGNDSKGFNDVAFLGYADPVK